MLTSVLVALMSAAPSVAVVQRLARAKAWDELYLTVATVDASKVAPKDARAIAVALSTGCAVLLETDAVLAYSLGVKSVAFSSHPFAVRCAARAAFATEQPTEALELLRRGLSRHPGDDGLSAELALRLRGDGDLDGARAAIAAVPREKRTTETEALRAALATDAPPGPEPRRVFGDRAREGRHFRFRYFDGQRDFGQRAEYEGRVEAALELARERAARTLGVQRERPVEVVLYSKTEFATEHGPWAASAIAGFYGGDAIHLNDSAEISARAQATLVHEFVHAVVDELAGFDATKVPLWLNEGLAELAQWQFTGRTRPEGRYDAMLRQLAAQRRLPSLSSMREDPLINSPDPGVAYSFAALAVRALVERVGMSTVVAVIRDVGAGTPFDAAFTKRTGLDFARFEEGLADGL